MKRLYRHIALATGLAMLLVLFATLHSCSADGLPGTPGNPEGEWAPLLISGVTTGSGISVQTRADGTPLTAGNIGIFRREDAANGYLPLNNIKFTYATPFWNTDEQILLGTADAVLAAYYPYSAETVNPLLLTSRKYSDAEGDLCYVNLTANAASSSLTLELQRIYARLVFTFTGNAYPGDGKVTSIRLAGEGITPAATLDLLDRAAFADPTNKGVYNVRKPVIDSEEIEIKDLTTRFTADTSGEADCLLVPTVLKGDITFTVMVDGVKMSGTIPAGLLCGAAGAEGTLQEGYQYNVNLVVKPVQLEVETIVKTEWEPVKVDGDYEIN